MNVIYSSRTLCTHTFNYKNNYLFFKSVAAAILSRDFFVLGLLFPPSDIENKLITPFFLMLCNSVVKLKPP